MIRSDLADNKIDLSSSDTIQIREDQNIINFPFGLENVFIVCQMALQRDYAFQFGYGTLSSSESNSTRLERRTAPPRYPFGLRNYTDVYQ